MSYREVPTVPLAEHRETQRKAEERIARLTGLLGGVNDKFDDLEKRSRSAALAWDFARKGLLLDLKARDMALVAVESSGARWRYSWRMITVGCVVLSFLIGLGLG